jgi:hypothetical protein
MKYLCTFLFLCVWAAQAQAPSVSAPWDFSQAIAAFIADAVRLTPLLDQLTPQQWVSQGASQTYVEQWNAAKNELGYLRTSAETLRNEPEKLTAALDTYFRMQAIETKVRSLAEGTKTYQNPAVGDLLLSVLGETSASRDKLQQHITDLAAQKEEELAVVDKEAQRCRGTINRQTSAPKPAAVKKSVKQ